jgi:hypothetical protein
MTMNADGTVLATQDEDGWHVHDGMEEGDSPVYDWFRIGTYRPAWRTVQALQMAEAEPDCRCRKCGKKASTCPAPEVWVVKVIGQEALCATCAQAEGIEPGDRHSPQ